VDALGSSNPGHRDGSADTGISDGGVADPPYGRFLELWSLSGSDSDLFEN
jgi:hypothetical protein